MADRSPPVSEHLLGRGRIRYLFILVWNFQEMLSFYRDLLGFETRYLDDGVCAFLGLPGQELQIALYPCRENMTGESSHIFMVIDVENIETATLHLKASGIAIGNIFPVPYGHAAQIKDPEGNIIEIHQTND